MNKTLESRVELRTAELEAANSELNLEVGRRDEAERALAESRDELVLLTQQLIEAQEEERRRVSRELHDSLGQTLGAIKYSLETVLATAGTSDTASLEALIGKTIEHVTTAIKETRVLAMNLRPPALDDIGTPAAVETLCKDFASMYGDIAFHVELEALNGEIPPELATPIYRIVQESLNNVVKHASAENVLVGLKVIDGMIKVEVLDDGVGFESIGTATTGAFKSLGKVGRLGMRERAANSNGVLQIESTPGEGTRVEAQWSIANSRNGLE
jgi:signal transduction histidine kinase